MLTWALASMYKKALEGERSAEIGCTFWLAIIGDVIIAFLVLAAITGTFSQILEAIL